MSTSLRVHIFHFHFGYVPAIVADIIINNNSSNSCYDNKITKLHLSVENYYYH